MFVQLTLPQSDGQTERANRTLEDMLRHFVSPSQDDWDLRLPCCDFAINNAWNQSTDSTPFSLNFGEHPRSPINVDVVCKLLIHLLAGSRMLLAKHVIPCCMLSRECERIMTQSIGLSLLKLASSHTCPQKA